MPTNIAKYGIILTDMAIEYNHQHSITINRQEQPHFAEMELTAIVKKGAQRVHVMEV